MGLENPDDPARIRPRAQPARHLLAEHAFARSHERSRVFIAWLGTNSGDYQYQAPTFGESSANEPVKGRVSALGGHPVKIDPRLGRPFAAAQPLGISPVETGLGPADLSRTGRRGDETRSRLRRSGWPDHPPRLSRWCGRVSAFRAWGRGRVTRGVWARGFARAMVQGHRVAHRILPQRPVLGADAVAAAGFRFFWWVAAQGPSGLIRRLRSAASSDRGCPCRARRSRHRSDGAPRWDRPRRCGPRNRARR